MKINGTIVNYYFHCKRQCYLHGNHLNLEDNSEIVQIGKALHDEKAKESKNTELSIENIKIDKLTKEYLIEIKKSDADLVASRWQLLFYLKKLKEKGIQRKGKLEIIEKKKSNKKVEIVELTSEAEESLNQYLVDIDKLLAQDVIPQVLNKTSCKNCAYYEYCYI